MAERVTIMNEPERVIISQMAERIIISEVGQPGPAGAAGGALRTTETVDESREIEADDVSKLLIIDTTDDDVELTIDPVTMEGRTFEIYCLNNTNTAEVTALSGVIRLKNLSNQVTVAMSERDSLRLFADGTNIIQL